MRHRLNWVSAVVSFTVFVGCGGATEIPGDGGGTGSTSKTGGAGGGMSKGGSPSTAMGGTVSMGGAISCTTMGCTTPTYGYCYFDGITVPNGAPVPSYDACSNCMCSSGLIVCSMSPCPASCYYAGLSYSDGSSFLATDGCNECSCMNGIVNCSAMNCICDPAREYWRSYVGISPSQCATIDFGCPSASSGFENTCGCGCEQSPACPEVVDCYGYASSTAAGGASGIPAPASKPAMPVSGAGGASGVSIDALPICAPYPECPLSPLSYTYY